MADAPRTGTPRDVIPLYPERATERVRRGRSAALLAAIGRLRVPAELAAILRVNARGALQFLAPALLLSTSAALLALLVGSVAFAIGMTGVSAGGLAAAAGQWTLLATAGGALAWRGFNLARERWP